MSVAKFVWLVGGAAVMVVASVASLGACSSTSATPPVDGGGPSTPDTGVGADTGPAVIPDAGTDTAVPPAADAGSEGGTCESPPSLFPETAPGVYCPFSAVDGGGARTCSPGEHCCEVPVGATSPSTCVPLGTPCPVVGSVDWQCEAPVDCTSTDGGAGWGPVCCGTGTPTTATHCGVTWPEWNAFTGTRCMASCPSPGITVCEQGSDCTTDAGTKCTASKSNGNDFGFCGP